MLEVQKTTYTHNKYKFPFRIIFSWKRSIIPENSTHHMQIIVKIETQQPDIQKRLM